MKEVMYPYALRATVHHQKTFNGISSFEPPVHWQLRSVPLGTKWLDILESYSCRFLLFRPDWTLQTERDETFAFLRAAMAEGRLVFLRRFDHGMHGDWLFALPRIDPDWERHRPPAEPNAAGFTPAEELARLLNNQPTYNGSLFGNIETPGSNESVSGTLQVKGWALSPHGIRSVTVLVDSARHRIPAMLVERPDASGMFPWYPRTPRPGFVASIPKPRGVGSETDVQVEVVDGSGAVLRLPDVLVNWK
jgi:hypothetical protein